MIVGQSLRLRLSRVHTYQSHTICSGYHVHHTSRPHQSRNSGYSEHDGPLALPSCTVAVSLSAVRLTPHTACAMIVAILGQLVMPPSRFHVLSGPRDMQTTLVDKILHSDRAAATNTRHATRNRKHERLNALTPHWAHQTDKQQAHYTTTLRSSKIEHVPKHSQLHVSVHTNTSCKRSRARGSRASVQS